MSIIGDLVANLTTDTTGWSKGLKSAGSMLASFAKSTLAPLAAVGAAMGAALGAKASLDAAREAVAAERKLEAVLRATGGAAGLSANEIAAYAGELQGVTNFSDDATIAVAGVLASFKNVKGDVFKDALASAQDMSAVMGTDLQGSVVQLGKALNDPIKGISALGRVGVTFSEEQKASIKALVKSNDLLGAQKIILGELKSEFGGAAKAMADPLIQANTVLGDVAENIGFAILPAVNELASMFTDVVGGAVTSTGEMFKTFGEDIAFGIRNASDLSLIALNDLTIGIIDMLPQTESVFQGIGTFVIATFDGLSAFFDAWFSNIKNGFIELGNVGKAIASGISAAFQSIKSGDITGAASAFGAAFSKTLAGQSGAGASRNPFSEFQKAFEETSKNATQGFSESGGLSAMLKAQNQQLLEGIGAREAERSATLAAKLAPITSTGEEITAPIAKAAKDGPVAALQQGSSAAFSAIQNAIRGGDKNGIDQVASNTKKQLQLTEDQNDLLSNIAEQGPDPLILASIGY